MGEAILHQHTSIYDQWFLAHPVDITRIAGQNCVCVCVCVCVLTRVVQIITATRRGFCNHALHEDPHLRTILPPKCQLSITAHGLLVLVFALTDRHIDATQKHLIHAA